MADVRALLAAERQSRRISHPHLTYGKSGLLMCNVCHLNVKSESLWEGHLRSANHKKNARATQENGSKPLKRKLDDVEETAEEEVESQNDGRKKTKSRPESTIDDGGDVFVQQHAPAPSRLPQEPAEAIRSHSTPPPTSTEPALPDEPEPTQTPSTSIPAVDEDEWAAFEREVAPLAQADYSSATISAAPVSAAQLEAQAQENKRRQQQEIEAEDEQEEGERRLEAEFEVMEEMEERVRKLKEKREALRLAERTVVDSKPAPDPGQESEVVAGASQDGSSFKQDGVDDEDEDDNEDEVDDWYS